MSLSLINVLRCVLNAWCLFHIRVLWGELSSGNWYFTATPNANQSNSSTTFRYYLNFTKERVVSYSSSNSFWNLCFVSFRSFLNLVSNSISSSDNLRIASESSLLLTFGDILKSTSTLGIKLFAKIFPLSNFSVFILLSIYFLCRMINHKV